MSVYEVYMEQFKITAWKDGCVFSTESLGTGWFDMHTVDTNHPRETNIIFTAASDNFAQHNSSIRKKQT